MHCTTIQELYNLRWYIQHLIDENECQYDDDQWTNPLSETHWIYKTNKHFMKYVIFTLQEMTPEQLKQNPITVHPNGKPDTDEGECNNTKEEEESTTSSDMSDKILNITQILMILKIKKSHKHQKHITFIMYATQQCMMKMIQQSLKMIDQKKILQVSYLTYLLKLQKSQNLQKYLKFLLYSTKQYIMKMICLKTNL